MPLPFPSRRPWLPAVALAALLAAAGCSPNEASLLQSGREHLAKSEFEAARVQAKNVLQANKENGEARVLLGRALLGLGDASGAEAEFRRAIEFGMSEEAVVPWLAKALVATGRGALLLSQYGKLDLKDDAAAAAFGTEIASAYMQTNAVDEADAALEAARRRKPDYLPAQVLAVRMKLAHEDVDGALAGAMALAKDRPGEAVVQALLGDMLATKGKTTEAIAAWRESLKLQPTQPNVFAAALTTLISNKDQAGAQSLFAEMQKVLPKNSQTMFFDALLSAGRGDYAHTRELMQQLLRGGPNDPRILLLAGEAELKLGSPAQAESLFNKAMQIAPKLNAARRMLAQAQLQSGQPAKALATLAPLLESKPPDAEALTIAAQAQMATGNAKAADQTFAKAVELNPENNRLKAARALAHLGQGNDASALSELEAAAARDSDDRVDLALVAARLRNGDVTGANRAIDKLAEKQPKSPKPEQLRGLLLLFDQKRDEARKHFEAASQLDADYLPALIKLSEIDAADGKLPEARARIEAFSKRQPKSSEAMMVMSRIATLENNETESIEWLEKAVKNTPQQPLPRLALIDRLAEARQSSRALEAAQNAATAMPDNLALLERLGRAQLVNDRGAEAVATFTKLVALQPKSIMPLLLLADAHNMAKNNNGVTDALRRAHEMAPDSPEVVQALVKQAMRAGKPEQAITIARKLQALRARDPLGPMLEGDIEASQQHWDQAAVAYRKAVDLVAGPNANPLPALRLYQALVRSGKAAESQRVVADWTKVHPKDVTFPNQFGDEAMAKKDYVEAEKQYRVSVERNPDSPATLNNLAYALAVQKKPGAVELAEKAAKRAPNQAAMLDTLALALESEGKFAKAVETQTRALALAPQAHQLRLQLARLKIAAGDKAGARDDLRMLDKLGDKFPQQAEVGELLKSINATR